MGRRRFDFVCLGILGALACSSGWAAPCGKKLEGSQRLPLSELQHSLLSEGFAVLEVPGELKPQNGADLFRRYPADPGDKRIYPFQSLPETDPFERWASEQANRLLPEYIDLVHL